MANKEALRELQGRLAERLQEARELEQMMGWLAVEAAGYPFILPLTEAREQFTRQYILETLERNGGNRTQTARDLGVDPRTIFRYLEREPDAPGPA